MQTRAVETHGARHAKSTPSADRLNGYPRENSLPSVQPALERPAFNDMGLRALDLGLYCGKLLERRGAVDAVRQSEVQAGIHGGSRSGRETSGRSTAWH